MLYYTSSNSTAVDSPFAKLLVNRPELQFVPGVPPISSTNTGGQIPDQQMVAALLGLDSADLEFVSRRVRHLAYIVRHSKFAAKANWRSYLEFVDDLAPRVDDVAGVSDILGATSTFKYTTIKTSLPSNSQLLWRVTVTGISAAPLSVKVGGVEIATFTATLAATPMGSSGYSMSFDNTSPSGNLINFSAELRTPYSGNCAPIYAAIRAKPDLVSRLGYGKSEYLAAIFEEDSVENAIAAFILIVDEL